MKGLLADESKAITSLMNYERAVSGITRISLPMKWINKTNGPERHLPVWI